MKTMAKGGGGHPTAHRDAFSLSEVFLSKANEVVSETMLAPKADGC